MNAEPLNLPPWEPPFNGTEAEAVFAHLDRQRITFRWKAADLDEGGLRATIPSSSVTLGGLLKHLALVEDLYFHRKILDEPMPEPWASVDWEVVGDGWDWRSAAGEPAADLYALYDAAAGRSRVLVERIVARGGLDAPSNATLPDGTRANVRRVVLDVVEEYGRHTGHADILREAVDGRTGEDPPWPP
ncbi:MAG: DinB family protein [Marmoricola sp.]